MIVSILNQFSKSSGLAARTAAVQGNGFGIKKLSGQKVGQPAQTGPGFEHANRR